MCSFENILNSEKLYEQEKPTGELFISWPRKHGKIILTGSTEDRSRSGLRHIQRFLIGGAAVLDSTTRVR
jgi:hypothetical protein